MSLALISASPRRNYMGGCMFSSHFWFWDFPGVFHQNHWGVKWAFAWISWQRGRRWGFRAEYHLGNLIQMLRTENWLRVILELSIIWEFHYLKYHSVMSKMAASLIFLSTKLVFGVNPDYHIKQILILHSFIWLLFCVCVCVLLVYKILNSRNWLSQIEPWCYVA